MASVMAETPPMFLSKLLAAFGLLHHSPLALCCSPICILSQHIINNILLGSRRVPSRDCFHFKPSNADESSKLVYFHLEQCVAYAHWRSVIVKGNIIHPSVNRLVELVGDSFPILQFLDKGRQQFALLSRWSLCWRRCFARQTCRRFLRIFGKITLCTVMGYLSTRHPPGPVFAVVRDAPELNGPTLCTHALHYIVLSAIRTAEDHNTHAWIVVHQNARIAPYSVSSRLM